MANTNLPVASGKISWKTRMRSWTFWIGLIGIVGGVILPYLQMSAEDLTTWKGLIDVIVKTIQNPYLIGSIVMAVLSFLGVLADPTTPGLSDSELVISREQQGEITSDDSKV